MIQYQGRLTGDAGQPPHTTVNITFTIFDDSTSGTLIWEELHPDVTVTESLFEVGLGIITGFGTGVFDGSFR